MLAPQASAPNAQSAQLNEFWALRTGQSLSMHRQLGRHADEFDAPILLLNADDTLLEPVVGYAGQMRLQHGLGLVNQLLGELGKAVLPRFRRRERIDEIRRWRSLFLPLGAPPASGACFRLRSFSVLIHHVPFLWLGRVVVRADLLGVELCDHQATRVAD